MAFLDSSLSTFLARLEMSASYGVLARYLDLDSGETGRDDPGVGPLLTESPHGRTRSRKGRVRHGCRKLPKLKEVFKDIAILSGRSMSSFGDHRCLFSISRSCCNQPTTSPLLLKTFPSWYFMFPGRWSALLQAGISCLRVASYSANGHRDSCTRRCRNHLTLARLRMAPMLHFILPVVACEVSRTQGGPFMLLK